MIHTYFLNEPGRAGGTVAVRKVDRNDERVILNNFSQ